MINWFGVEVPQPWHPSWWTFERCSKLWCLAEAGEPCITAKGPRGVVVMADPHRGRPRIPWQLR